MGRTFGFLSLIVVVGYGAYIYMNQAQSMTVVGGSPETAVDVVGVRNDLMAIANAEKRYFVTNGKYASIDELRVNGDIHIPTRQNFVYSADATDTGFRIVATYSGVDPKAPRRITVDDTMRLTTE
jgi:hypothetical protein